MELAQRFYARLNQSTLGQNQEDIEKVINTIKSSYVSANVGSYLPTTLNPNEYIYRDTLNKLTELLTRIKQAQNISQILNSILEFIQHRSFAPGGASSELICCLLINNTEEQTEITNLLSEKHSDFVAHLRELIRTPVIVTEVDRLITEEDEAEQAIKTDLGSDDSSAGASIDKSETAPTASALMQTISGNGSVKFPAGFAASTGTFVFKFGRDDDSDTASDCSHTSTAQALPIPIKAAPVEQSMHRDPIDAASIKFGNFDDDNNDDTQKAGGSFPLPSYAAVSSLITSVAGLLSAPDLDSGETPARDLSPDEMRRRFALE